MGVYEDLNNPDLFEENAPGDYTYSESAYGKTASGQLTLDAEVQRDPVAQRTAGGEARRTAGNEYGVDDGGHLIGARFGGAAGEENLTPQDRNLNRSGYKDIENGWADHLKDGDKVYVNVESYDSDGAGRPTNYMGYAIIEHTDEMGNTSREVEYISLNNESRAEQESWMEAEEEYYAEHPEAAQAQQEENTAMPYIWDEEQGEAVENPYYQENTTDYAPEPEASSELDQSDYTPVSEQGEESGSDYTAGTSYDGADLSSGSGNDMDMD